MHHTDHAQQLALFGDWTLHGVGGQITKLKGIMDGMSGECRTVTLDCGDIEAIDICGCQLIYVCMTCLKDNGITSTLANLSEETSAVLEKNGFSVPFYPSGTFGFDRLLPVSYEY